MFNCIVKGYFAKKGFYGLRFGENSCDMCGSNGSNYLLSAQKIQIMAILPATLSDVPALLTLVNSAFRGDAARQGWTHEADLLHGELRTDEPSLSDLLQQPGGTVLKYCSDTGHLEGCVYLQLKTNELYLGMLTVMPALQGAGIGKLLLAAAEAHAQQLGCTKIRMRVLSTRYELLAWYERHGYQLTGETEPYAFDHKFGVPTQPLEFVILQKSVYSS